LMPNNISVVYSDSLESYQMSLTMKVLNGFDEIRAY
jgi:hypothetical protein